MSTQLATTEQKPLALAVMAERLGVDEGRMLATLQATVFKGASPEELVALVVVANTYGLNPLTKEIYAFPNRGGIQPIVSIDGWNRIANEHPQMDGFEFEFAEDGSACTCKIYRSDRSHPVVVTEYLEECRRNTDQWRQMPRRMLRHKAFIQCARMAFGFAGIYDQDEAEGIGENAQAAAPQAKSEPYDPYDKPLPVDDPPAIELPPTELPETVRGRFMIDGTTEDKGVFTVELINGEGDSVFATTTNLGIGQLAENSYQLWCEATLERDGDSYKIVELELEQIAV